MKKLTLALAAALSLSTANAADYVIDSKGAHASINFKIQHLGYSWLTGRFNDFKGTFSYDDAAPSAAKIMVTIDTDSIDSNHAERDKHLKSPDFFDATIRKLRSRVPASKRKMVGSLRTVRSQCVLSAKRSPCRLNWPVPLIRVVES